MKTKIYQLLLAAFLVCNVSVAHATRIYLNGPAVTGNYSLGMPMMIQNGDTYTWVGDLQAGNLKFAMTNRYFGDTYGPTTNEAALAIGTHQLGLNSNGTGTDNQFVVTAGRYSLTLTLGETPTLVVADGTDLPDQGIAAADVCPEAALYAIGNATTADWTPDKSIEIAETEYGKYAGSLTLKAGTDLELKFLAQKDWGTQYGPKTDGEAITAAGTFSLVKPASDDPKYHTTLTADTKFSVAIDISAGTLTLSPYKLSTMWMIGDAVGGWDFNKNGIRMNLSAVEDSVFTWEGNLQAGTFKFCGNKYEFTNEAFGATVADTTLKAGNYSVQPIDAADKKFKVVTAGTYSLTLNLKTLTLVVADATPTAIDAVSEPTGTALEQDRAVKVLRNGRIYILRGESSYDLLGTRH